MVLFPHIPKTAGSHFKRILRELYTPGRVFYDYDGGLAHPGAPVNTDPLRWRREANQAIRSLSPDVEMILGHFPVTKYFDLLPSSRLMTWIREPVRRLISTYFFLKFQKDVKFLANERTCRNVLIEAARTVGFAEFSEIPAVQNSMTRHFLHPAQTGDFAFIGIQEHFESDLDELGGMVGWPRRLPPVERTNSNPFPGYREAVREIVANHHLVRRIERMNGADVDFYRDALDRRRKRRQARKRLWWLLAPTRGLRSAPGAT